MKQQLKEVVTSIIEIVQSKGNEAISKGYRFDLTQCSNNNEQATFIVHNSMSTNPTSENSQITVRFRKNATNWNERIECSCNNYVVM